MPFISDPRATATTTSNLITAQLLRSKFFNEADTKKYHIIALLLKQDKFQ
jgi:hypothetical protein